MRPTWGIDGWEVAKHGRILSSDRVPRAFARRQTRGKTLTSHFPHPMFSSKAARRRTTRARSARFPRRRYRLPRGISPRRSAIPCPEALPRGTHAHQRTAVPHVPGRKGFAAGLDLSAWVVYSRTEPGAPGRADCPNSARPQNSIGVNQIGHWAGRGVAPSPSRRPLLLPG